MSTGTDRSTPPPSRNAPPPSEAWSADDLARNPHAAEDKAHRVRRMFAAIAPSYDLNNRLHSLWRDQAWRRAAVRMAELKDTDRVVDVACGTGDLSLAMEDALWEPGEGGWPPARGQVTGIDFTYDMLPLAKRKDAVRRRDGRGTIRWVNGDAMALPLPDACCDVVSIAFGIRNVADPARAMREFYRVLRPGGRLIVLEFSTPTNPVLRSLHNLYCGRVMPITATLIARDKSGAYKYLPRSVDTFLSREGMSQMMRESGFSDVALKPLTFGIAVVYRGLKGTGA